MAEAKELMSGAIPVSCPPLAEAPEETTRVPLGQDTVPITWVLVEPPQKYWVTYWMGLEAGHRPTRVRRPRRAPRRRCPRPRWSATAIRGILMTLLHWWTVRVVLDWWVLCSGRGRGRRWIW